jgi:hypothetical protein
MLSEVPCFAVVLAFDLRLLNPWSGRVVFPIAKLAPRPLCWAILIAGREGRLGRVLAIVLLPAFLPLLAF